MDGAQVPERHELEAFLTLAEELHFGRTAERLRLSQARVSQTIRKLERRVGAPLFERTSRRVALTPLGARLRDDLRPLWEGVREAMARAQATARGVDGVLRVGFLGSGAGELTSAIMDTFTARHPGCEIVMRETHFADPLGPLRAGEVDMLITRLPVREPDLVVGPVVLSEPRVVAVPARHPFARRAAVSLEDLARDTVFGVTGPAPDYWWDFHVPRFTPGGRPIPRGQDVATFQELLALIAAGRGISPMAASVERYYARPDIAFVPLKDAPRTEVALVWRAAGVTARIRAFAQAARDAVTANGGPARF
ncbi:LysR family transcriptional regulator [Thermomonospora cellulosilytica]|uniref:DNA-binding transcriptional LysR family regulator n=1 Tax=Thermomonospora cellulosilytica TaxID=1411118 RepID=A0A7W3R7F7_9ACTN|nr:LysR substrate-binding domain-containing protein [Thermomonospora cellulosilytica]MBA9002459.1 DNA-binding transcriptional LysR family regulator [Thermomonospora cellulosilytica]